jgi:hypothetical protein
MEAPNSQAENNEATAPFTLTPQEAFMVIAFSSIAINQYLTQSDIKHMTRNLSRLELFMGYELKLGKIADLLYRKGPEVLLPASREALSPELRETAFALAVDLALNDGQIKQPQKEYLIDLCYGLDISAGIALKIIQVILIKNRGRLPRQIEPLS